ncbi:hypothetical protein JKF63_06008 [Porcisia hertigi]|uniref:Uncharacterized protein n=1 Tax=Porcisia hertigi TaxID=2761500 RepID=A0A836IKJ3_9TRYP|nr:hypothetical protein JKF63_06008 [Porcisia hertigi]
MDSQGSFSVYSAGAPPPPHAQTSLTTSEPLLGMSRKSGRREEETVGHIGVPGCPMTHALRLPPPLTHLEGTSSSATDASVSLPPLCPNWRSWGASLPPRGYTMSRRHLVEAPLGDGGQLRSEQIAHQNDEGNVAMGPGQPSATYTPFESARRWKRRRTERVGFSELLKEVFMYLDAVASTQQHRPDHGCIAGHAEEDEENSIQRSTPIPSYTAHLRKTTASSSLSHGSGAHSGGNSGPVGATSTLLMSVDSAVQDTVRVLQQCWEYRGAPHDAFEPVRLLSPLTVHLLLTYGRHTITPDGQYVVLCGGAEHLPWVGCLHSILLAFLYRHSATPAITVATGHSGCDVSVTPALEGVSRVLLLNCHSFGWMDHIGSGEYEQSHRQLYQARDALVGLLEDPRYTAFGRPAGCPLCMSSMVGGDASTLVLLGDTIVMEGGAPSLGLASPRYTFTAHYQYGRGIACCLPEMGARLPVGATCSGPVEAGSVGDTPVSGTGLCAAHRRPLRQAAMSFRRERHLRSNLHQQHQDSVTSSNECQVEEYLPTLESPGEHSYSRPWFDARCSLPWQTRTPATSCRLPAVCCGVCRAVGVLGQAVLLGPTGPLVIHLQFDEREWLHQSTRVVPASTTDSWLSATNVDTAAVCPSPPSHLASQYADERTNRVGALLYAIMQGESTAGFEGHCGSSPPIGGSVSLAELVEWLARFLHAPPPALVVEWHASTFPSTSTTTCTPRMFQHVTPSLLRNSGAVSDSQMSLSSSCAPIAQRHSPLAQSRLSATTSPLSMDCSHTTIISSLTPRVASVCSSDEGYATASLSTDSKQYDGNPKTSSASHGVPTSSVSLGMLTQPRYPTVMQLFEVYRDVSQSRADVPAIPAATSSASSVGSSRAPPFTQASGASGLPAEAMQPHALLDWVLAAQESLRRCEATYLFDGVERPLVLAKELEVAAEAERFLNASSVATSLQFRHCSPHL